MDGPLTLLDDHFAVKRATKKGQGEVKATTLHSCRGRPISSSDQRAGLNFLMGHILLLYLEVLRTSLLLCENVVTVFQSFLYWIRSNFLVRYCDWTVQFSILYKNVEVFL